MNVITTAPPEPRPTRRGAIRNRLRRPDVEPREVVLGARTAVTETAIRAYNAGVDRLLTAPERIASVEEAHALLESDEHFEEFSDRVQKVALAAVPMLRIARGAGRFARVPPVLIASTALSAGMTVRRGVRELQVIAALIEHRIEQATGERADPALVKALAVAVYRNPKYEPAPSRNGLRLGTLAARLALRGAIGRDTGSAATRALEAADRLDAAAQAARWKASDAI